MEVALVAPTTIRLKGKLATLLVDPVATRGKQQAEAALLLNLSKTDAEIEGLRLTMAGPGEYEVSGVKITGIRNEAGILYYLTLDNVKLLVGAASSLKGKESLRDVDIAVLLAEGLVDQSALATVADSVAIFYGPQTQENAKVLGKEAQSVNKYVITKEKLPQEMEVVILQ